MIKWMTRWLLVFQIAIAVAIFLALTETGFIASKLGAGVFSIAVILLFRAAITANNFLIASAYGKPIHGAPALSGVQWLRLLGSEFVATMLISSWTMAFRTFRVRLAPQARGLPVLLIHGYGCNSGYWHAMSKVLLGHGVSHRAVDLEPVFGDIDEYGGLIDSAITTLRAETGHDKVVLVAHSMGGLAARAYLRDYGHTAVAKVITLGTPHHGTGLANFGVGTNTRQMCWQETGGNGSSSAWLAALAARETNDIRRLFVSIYSTHDNIISPRSSCLLEGAKHIEFHAIGHVALALAPAIQACVIAEIDAASRLSPACPVGPAAAA